MPAKPGVPVFKLRARTRTPELKILRVTRGVTLKEISRRLGICISSAWNIENGVIKDPAAADRFKKALE